jgi:hypothetical protein
MQYAEERPNQDARIPLHKQVGGEDHTKPDPDKPLNLFALLLEPRYILAKRCHLPLQTVKHGFKALRPVAMDRVPKFVQLLHALVLTCGAIAHRLNNFLARPGCGFPLLVPAVTRLMTMDADDGEPTE